MIMIFTAVMLKVASNETTCIETSSEGNSVQLGIYHTMDKTMEEHLYEFLQAVVMKSMNSCVWGDMDSDPSSESVITCKIPSKISDDFLFLH